MYKPVATACKTLCAQLVPAARERVGSLPLVTAGVVCIAWPRPQMVHRPKSVERWNSGERVSHGQPLADSPLVFSCVWVLFSCKDVFDGFVEFGTISIGATQCTQVRVHVLFNSKTSLTFLAALAWEQLHCFRSMLGFLVTSW